MRNRNRMGALIVAFVGMGLMACQGDREGADGLRAGQERDSAGIEIVENARPPEGSRLGWRIGPEPSLSIGKFDGEDPYIFYRALDAHRLPDGRIVVAHRSSGELRVFDASGIHLESWGRAGEGPGEFPPSAGLTAVEPWQGDSIMAWYSGFAGMVSIFDTNGNFGRSFRLGGLPPDTRWPRASRADGTILVTVNEEPVSSGIEIWNGDGTRAAYLGSYSESEMYQALSELEQEYYPYPVVYSRTLELGLWGALVFVGLSNRYEFKASGRTAPWHGSCGSTVTRAPRPRPTTTATSNRKSPSSGAGIHR